MSAQNFLRYHNYGEKNENFILRRYLPTNFYAFSTTTTVVISEK